MANEELENLAFRLPSLPPILWQNFLKQSLNADEQRNSNSSETKVSASPLHEFKHVKIMSAKAFVLKPRGHWGEVQVVVLVVLVVAPCHVSVSQLSLKLNTKVVNQGKLNIKGISPLSCWAV